MAETNRAAAPAAGTSTAQVNPATNHPNVQSGPGTQATDALNAANQAEPRITPGPPGVAPGSVGFTATAPNAGHWENDQLTRKGMEHVIRSGGSVVRNGILLTGIEQLPSDADLALATGNPDELDDVIADEEAESQRRKTRADQLRQRQRELRDQNRSARAAADRAPDKR